MVRCAVGSCGADSYGDDYPDMRLRMFKFPDNPVLAARWVKACNNTKRISIKTDRVCSHHFAEDDVVLSMVDRCLGLTTKRTLRRLKEGTVPTLNLHSAPKEKEGEDNENRQLIESLADVERKNTLAESASRIAAKKQHTPIHNNRQSTNSVDALMLGASGNMQQVLLLNVLQPGHSSPENCLIMPQTQIVVQPTISAPGQAIQGEEDATILDPVDPQKLFFHVPSTSVVEPIFNYAEKDHVGLIKKLNTDWLTVDEQNIEATADMIEQGIDLNQLSEVEDDQMAASGNDAAALWLTNQPMFSYTAGDDVGLVENIQKQWVAMETTEATLNKSMPLLVDNETHKTAGPEFRPTGENELMFICDPNSLELCFSSPTATQSITASQTQIPASEEISTIVEPFGKYTGQGYMSLMAQVENPEPDFRALKEAAQDQKTETELALLCSKDELPLLNFHAVPSVIQSTLSVPKKIIKKRATYENYVEGGNFGAFKKVKRRAAKKTKAPGKLKNKIEQPNWNHAEKDHIGVVKNMNRGNTRGNSKRTVLKEIKPKEAVSMDKGIGVLLKNERRPFRKIDPAERRKLVDEAIRENDEREACENARKKRITHDQVSQRKRPKFNQKTTDQSVNDQKQDSHDIQACIERENNLKSQLSDALQTLSVTQKALLEAQKRIQVLHYKNDKWVKILQQIFTPGQIARLTKDRMTKWGPDDIAAAVALRAECPEAYKYLKNRRNFPLPAVGTLVNYAKKLKIKEGILTNVLSLMKIKGAKMPARDKITVLSFDETPILSVAMYDRSVDKIRGPHKTAQVVMARGLYSPWRQPIYFDFDAPMTSGTLIDILKAVKVAGFQVVAFVSDMDTGNLNLWNSMGVTRYNNYVTLPNVADSDIYVFLDAVELAKGLKNEITHNDHPTEAAIATKDSIPAAKAALDKWLNLFTGRIAFGVNWTQQSDILKQMDKLFSAMRNKPDNPTELLGNPDAVLINNNSLRQLNADMTEKYQLTTVLTKRLTLDVLRSFNSNIIGTGGQTNRPNPIVFIQHLKWQILGQQSENANQLEGCESLVTLVTDMIQTIHPFKDYEAVEEAEEDVEDEETICQTITVNLEDETFNTILESVIEKFKSKYSELEAIDQNSVFVQSCHIANSFFAGELQDDKLLNRGNIVKTIVDKTFSIFSRDDVPEDFLAAFVKAKLAAHLQVTNKPEMAKIIKQYVLKRKQKYSQCEKLKKTKKANVKTRKIQVTQQS